MGPNETVQQSARVGVRIPILNRDDGDLEDGVGEIGVHGETGEAGPNAGVVHGVLVGVVPPVGDVQRLDGVDTAVVGHLVEGPRLAVLIEHMDGTDYMVSVADKKETPEQLTTLLAHVSRGADAMIRALDVLRAIGYVDVRPIALLGRQIVFGLDRVSLEVEIIENSDGELECGISVAGVNVENVEEIESVLEENDVDVI